MRQTVFQRAELRDENDNIVQQGAYGKGSALSNSTNDGWIDYVMNNLEALYGIAKDEVVPVSALPSSGDMNKTYLLTTTGVCYRWSGTAWVEISSSEAVGRAEAAADLAEEWATKTDGTVADNEYSAKYYSNVSKDWANKLNATVDGSEYSAKHYAGVAEGWAEDAEDTAEDIADHLAQIDQNTGGVSANSKRIGNIEKLLQGNLYDYDTDDDTAYTKSVPAGAMPYAGIEKLGGKTVVWNQLSTNGENSQTVYGITFTKNSDNTYTLNGTAIVKSYFNFIVGRFSPLITGHKYLLRGTPTDAPSALGTRKGFLVDRGAGAIGECTITGDDYVQITTISNGKTFDNTTYKPQLYDLTLMYGAGNEPSTVEEFQQMFPADYYAYNAGTLLSAGVTEVVSKDTNNATLQTIPIPAEIQALEGYGWSANIYTVSGGVVSPTDSLYNYIDFETKKFVQRVASVDLGSLTWTKNVGSKRFYSTAITDVKQIVGWGVSGDLASLLPTKYVRWHYIGNGDTDNIYGIYDKKVYVRDDALLADSNVDGNAFKALMNGVMLYYELATPVEVDISAYLTDDNLINVEAGGTLTFPNQNGTDYQIPVPSDETYMIDLQEAINNG